MFAIDLINKGNSWSKAINISSSYYKVSYKEIHKQLHEYVGFKKYFKLRKDD